MSLTTCNYCSLKYLRATAEESGRTVTVEGSDEGNDVFVHPKSRLPDMSVDDSGNHGPDWVAWMAKISDECCC